jgi:hypothetical protein
VAVILAAMPPAAKGATAGELLEKAIYAEETVGNLDEAIKLYEQVIAEAKTAKSAAAKAQYRLGLIYEKQGRPELAAAAFRAVVENYAEEKELVAQARKRLPSALQLLPEPWGGGDELQLNVKLPTGLDIGTMIYRVESDKHEGKEVWKCTTRGLITANGANSVSHVICDKESFAPIKSFWKHSLLGEADATYGEGSVEVKVAGKDKPISLKTATPTFDNEQCVELFRRLPLKVGYKTEISVVSSLGSGEIKLNLEVPEMETLDVPAGKFECYKLELNIGQTFWISNDEHRYVVRFAAGGVTADLARVDKDGAKSAEFQGERFKLTLPGGWRSYAPQAGLSDEKSKTVFLLDPNAVVDAQVRVGALDTLETDERKSPTAWTEAATKKISKAVKNFKLRDPAVKDVKLGEHTGAVMIADYVEGKQATTMYGIAVFADKTAINLRFTMPTNILDELQPQLDEIVNSFKFE